MIKSSDKARQMEWARFMAGLDPDYTVNRINDELPTEAELAAREQEYARSHLTMVRSMMLLALPSAIFLALFVYAVYCGVLVIAQHLDGMK